MADKIYNDFGEELDPITLLPLSTKVDFTKIDLHGNKIKKIEDDPFADWIPPVFQVDYPEIDIYNLEEEDYGDLDTCNILPKLNVNVPLDVIQYATCTRCETDVNVSTVRLNTNYVDEKHNWDTLCNYCEDLTRDYYEERWLEYYSSQYVCQNYKK